MGLCDELTFEGVWIASHTLSSVCWDFFFFFFCFFVEELEVVVFDSVERLRRLAVSTIVKSRGVGGSGSVWEWSCAISCVAVASCSCRETMVGI